MKKLVNSIHQIHLLNFTIMFLMFFMFNQNSFSSQKTIAEMKLANGLEVITVEDHSSPLVSIVVRVGAGAAYENEQLSGISHLLEHLSFDGTDQRSRKELQDTMDLHGGYLNAFTRHDFTAYEIVVSPSEVSTGLDVLSDMLFYSSFPKDEVKKEKKVVVEEIRKDLDNPSSLTTDFFLSKVFAGTNYQYPVIGSEYNVRTIPTEIIKKYHNTWYRPNNMTLIAVGDFSKEMLLPQIKEYFGHITAVPLKERTDLSHFTINSGTWTKLAATVQGTYISVAYPAPKPESEAAASFEVISELLNNGDNSLLSKAFKSAKISVRYHYGYYSQYRHFGFLEFHFITGINFKDKDKIITILQNQLNKLVQKEQSKKEIEQIKINLTSQTLFEKEKFLRYARNIAYCNSLGNNSIWKNRINNLEKVSPTTVKKFAKEFLSDAKPLVTIVKGLHNKEQNKTLQKPDKILKKNFSNGLTVILEENHYLPIISSELLIKGRVFSEKSPGLLHFLSSMLPQGTKQHNAVQISNILQQIGGNLQVTDNPFMPFDDYYFSPDYSYIRLEYLSQFSKKGIQFLHELVSEATFPKQKIITVKQQLIQSLMMKHHNPSYLANRQFISTLFPDNPVSNPIRGTMKSLQSVNQKALIAQYNQTYQPQNMILSIKGDFSSTKLLSVIKNTLGTLPKGQLHNVEFSNPVKIDQEIIKKSKIKSQQAAIFMGNRLNTKSQNPIVFKLLFKLLDNRLSEQIREQKGLAYSVGAYFSKSNNLSWFAMYASIHPGKEDETISLMKNSIKNLVSKPFSDKELTLAREEIIGRSLRYHQRRINQAHFYNIAEMFHGDYKFDKNQNKRLKNISNTELKKAVMIVGAVKGFVISIVSPN